LGHLQEYLLKQNQMPDHFLPLCKLILSHPVVCIMIMWLNK
jgi:hypothetical protein